MYLGLQERSFTGSHRVPTEEICNRAKFFVIRRSSRRCWMVRWCDGLQPTQTDIDVSNFEVFAGTVIVLENFIIFLLEFAYHKGKNSSNHGSAAVQYQRKAYFFRMTSCFFFITSLKTVER